MSAVVDASVLVAALVDTGPHGLWAETIIESRPLHAPALLPVEVTSVLRRLELTRRLTTAEANAAHEDLMQLELQLHAFEPFSDRIWELRSGVTCYDAWYVALAEAFGLPLATLDERLCKAHGPRCEFLMPAKAAQRAK